MTGNSECNTPAGEPEDDCALAEEIRLVLAMTEGKDPVELGRRAKAAAEMMKAAMIWREFDGIIRAAEGPIDLAGEEKLRADLLRRLDDIAARIAAEEGLEYPAACRPVFDRP